MRLSSRILGILAVACWLLAGMGLQRATAAPLATNIDFDGFEGAGCSSGSGALPAGEYDSDMWAVVGFGDAAIAFEESCIDPGAMPPAPHGDLARGISSGGASSGGLYAFDVGSGDIAFGVQPGGSDFTPGTFTLRTRNDTGALVDSVDVDYSIWVFNNAPRSNSFDFSYSTDDVTYTPVGALDFDTPDMADGSPAWVETIRNTTLNSLGLADGDFLYLRWSSDDVSGSGQRDEFGVDNIVITQVTPTAVTFSQQGIATSGTLASVVFLVLGLLAATTAVFLRRRQV